LDLAPPSHPTRLKSEETVFELEMEKKPSLILTAHSHPRRESTNSTHVGRGGAANVFKPSEKEIEVAKRDNSKWESAVVDDGKPEKGLADRGKEFFSGLVGGKK
jgi:hypothetical protein